MKSKMCFTVILINPIPRLLNSCALLSQLGDFDSKLFAYWWVHFLSTGTETGFHTEEEETSGYESEGGHSVSPGVMKDSSPATVSPPSGRRPRTAFTAEQINSLEKAFKRNAYLGTQDKADLCKRLNLSDKQVDTFLFKYLVQLNSLSTL